MLSSDYLAKNERPMEWPTLLEQIGRMNVLAISGGRVLHELDGTIVLPVGRGYSVRITLSAGDTHTVERVYTRKNKSGVAHTIHRMTDVYCDEIGEVAYYASCFVSHPFGEKVEA